MDERIQVVLGDITTFAVDAIVNAANNSLLGGGGVDGAIHRAAGPALLEECRGLKGCRTGEAKVTKGYALPASHVIHTVGPVWRGGTHGEDNLLANCYRNSLEICRMLRLTSIAFPSVSTGVYDFPVHRASRIAILEVRKGLASNDELRQVLFVCFDNDTFQTYLTAMSDQSSILPTSPTS